MEKARPKPVVTLVAPNSYVDDLEIRVFALERPDRVDRCTSDGFDSAISTKHKVAGTLRCADGQGTI
ncbi:MAG: hypothetical protein ACK449_06535 [Planctomycetota bacterium]